MNEYIYEGKRYRTVNRKAKVGENVLIIDAEDMNRDGYENGDIFTVEYLPKGFSDLVDTDAKITLFDSEYHVLEPLESEEVTVDTELALVEGTQASEQVIEMFTALSRKIVSLERQLADTQRNVERQAEELENAKHRISKHATMFGAVEEMVNDINDDVIMLDERTQVVNAITKFYEEGRR
jgi:wobble nucleotide-excising tRNase